MTPTGAAAATAATARSGACDDEGVAVVEVEVVDEQRAGEGGEGGEQDERGADQCWSCTGKRRRRRQRGGGHTSLSGRDGTSLMFDIRREWRGEVMVT